MHLLKHMGQRLTSALSTPKAEIGDFNFKKKQEKLSPNVVTTFARMDNQINVIQSYKSITESINRTEGYKLRYERFARYLNDYNPEG